ncbi:uncharacterized protein LOC100901927 [Galendromus occidentalis]|uniref:Uncharacterized protein LOC100901927 n=1 Tax=Galendromus occidentalis TaxID=34638 RepID=A0AAJ7L766_9ACAR|nr:uncharacterized protein LOC100901927 [Galendromus occidentalis]
MSRRSVASTPLSPDELPDLPDIEDHSEGSSESSVRAAAVTSSYSEICLSAEEDLDDDLLPGEIQDLNSVQDTTDEITKLVEKINQGEESLVAEPERRARQIPTSLPVETMQVLPTFEAAFGRPPDAEVAREVSGGPLEQQVYVVDDIDEKIRQASRATSLAATPAPDISRLPSILADLESDARKLANSVQHMMETLSSQLRNVTRLTADFMAAYETGVIRACDAADANVKSMYRLLAKYEELSNAMKPVCRTAQEVKEIKQTLAHFESLVDVKQSKAT